MAEDGLTVVPDYCNTDIQLRQSTSIYLKDILGSVKHDLIILISLDLMVINGLRNIFPMAQDFANELVIWRLKLRFGYGSENLRICEYKYSEKLHSGQNTCGFQGFRIFWARICGVYRTILGYALFWCWMSIFYSLYWYYSYGIFYVHDHSFWTTYIGFWKLDIFGFANDHILGIFLPLDLLFKYWNEHTTIGLLHIKLLFSVRIFHVGVLCLATGHLAVFGAVD